MSGVRVRDLCFSYPAQRPALDHISFEIHANESVGIVGPNGAGKTTLFLCLAGILPVPLGAISVEGLDPTLRDHRRALPAQLGIVFQDSDDQLFCPTVWDDVAFGPLNLGLPSGEVRQRVSEALQQTGLTGFDERIPMHLSAGEKRRAALAGVLAMRPGIILLDEPSTHLDPRGRRTFMELIKSIPATKLIASHDLGLILDLCERTIVLDRGQIVADGTTFDILGEPDLMAAHGLEVPAELLDGRIR